MKIIFLDIDGVLNCSEWLKKQSKKKYCEINPEKVKLLAKIIAQTNAKIVLVSSWRELDTNNDMYRYLVSSLNQYNITILDKTAISPDYNRPKEISLWLKEHPYITNYIILDDDFSKEDYGQILGSHLIHTSFWEPDGGLREEHVEAAIQILNSNNK